MLFLIPAGILACVFADKVSAECEKKFASVDRKVAEAHGRHSVKECLEASEEEWEKHCGSFPTVQIPDHCGGGMGVFATSELLLLKECAWDIRRMAVVVAVAEGRRRHAKMTGERAA
jgi:hypothetical protein